MITEKKDFLPHIFAGERVWKIREIEIPDERRLL